MDDVFAEHIRLAADKGLSREEIRALLVEAGWPERTVNKYIEKTFKTLEKGVILRIHGLVKRYGDHIILDGVDFDVRRGEIFGLIGMSGAGKTTLLNLLVGFLTPERGDVLLALHENETESIFRNPLVVKKHVGFSTQSPSFYMKLTVRENMEHFAKLYQMTEPDLTRRITALVDLVGLTEARDVIAAHLSGGMQKRLDIACSLLHDPDILILDEPTADLDPIMRKQLWELIRQINVKGTTIILASHFLAEIELLCSRIAVLQNKRIIELGTTQELRDIYSKNYEIFYENYSKNYNRLIKMLESRKRVYTKVSQEDGELVIETPIPEKVLPILAAYAEKAKGELQSLHVARPTLGRVFEAVVKK